MSQEKAVEVLEDTLENSPGETTPAALVGQAFPEVADHVDADQALAIAERVIDRVNLETKSADCGECITMMHASNLYSTGSHPHPQRGEGVPSPPSKGGCSNPYNRGTSLTGGQK